MQPFLAVEPQVKVLSMELQVKSADPPTPFIMREPQILVELTCP